MRIAVVYWERRIGTDGMYINYSNGEEFSVTVEISKTS